MSRNDRDVKSISLRLAILFVLLAFIAYSAVINSYFLSDDFDVVGRILAGDWPVIWASEHGGFFRPLFTGSFILDSFFWGGNPAGYHLTNIALHGLNSLLVCAFAQRLVRRLKLSEEHKRGLSLAAGLLFLLHPSHTESVSFISGRADLLATLFCLASLLAYVAYAETKRVLSLILSLTAFALALLSKETAISLPFMLLATGVFFAPVESRKAALKESLKTGALFFSVLFVFILIRRFALGSLVGGYGAGQHLNFSPGWIRDRFLQASLRALLPAPPLELSSVLLKPLQSPVFIVFALACIALIVLLLRRRRAIYDETERREQNRLALLLLSLFLFSLLPVINLRLSLFNTQGERFVYWPSVFTSILLATVAAALLRSAKWQLVLIACLLVFYSVSLYRTNQTWAEAARLSRSIKEELSVASPQKRLLIINAPDNLRGAPVYHNGLEEALRFFQKPGRTGAVSILTLQDIQSTGDEFELKREGDDFTLRPLNPADGFTTVSDPSACLERLERSTNSVRFRLKPCPEGFDIFFFNAGRMYRVL
jgi:hypothetical protein